MQMLDIEDIYPSPYQHRKLFNDAMLIELARSIETDGLIQPITVRPNGSRYELIAGERRWRAVRDHTKLTNIMARVLHVNDLQARRMCAAENLQRSDLSAVEEVLALVDVVDTEMLEASQEYAGYGEDAKDRVKYLLGKMNNDDRNGTDYFTNKFVSNVESIFATLPKPKNWQSFFIHDLRLVISVHEDVREVAIEERLNKSQTIKLQEFKESLPENDAKELFAQGGDAILKRIKQETFFSETTDSTDDDLENLRDASADRIKKASRMIKAKECLPLENHQLINQSSCNEWYTPAEFIEAARLTMGGIDLDPASSEIANKRVRAKRFFSESENGLDRNWDGRIWLNPPYGKLDDGDSNQAAWSAKLIDEFRSGRISQACLLVNAVPGNAWFRPLWDFMICFIYRRIRFLDISGEQGQPTHSNAIVYFGENESGFLKNFSDLGAVVKRMSFDSEL